MLNFFKTKRSKRKIIKSPLSGKIVSLDNVPDDVFAQKLVGDGIAIEPTNEWLIAPVAGTIVNLCSTKHAIGIVTRDNLEVLIHLGIETVDLKGEGFEAVVKEGQEINPGDRLIKINWSYIKNKVPTTISPIIITNMGIVKSIEFLKEGSIRVGENLLAVNLK